MPHAEAFLALWNGRAADRNDYDVWHTREHVAERLSVPGIRSAVRYDDGQGPLPEYFTLYTMADAAVFESTAYLNLLHNPSPWSRDMRPAFRRFLRVPCATTHKAGGGLGGCCITVPLHRQPTDDIVRQLLALPHVTGVCSGMALPDAAGVSFTIALDGDGVPAGVLVIEGIRRSAFVAEVGAVLTRHADLVEIDRITSYAFAFAVSTEDAATVPPLRQDDARHLVGDPS